MRLGETLGGWLARAAISRLPYLSTQNRDMRRAAAPLLLGAFVLCGTCAIGWGLHAETNRVTFPADLDKLVHYTTVRRGNVTEHILTSPEAIAAGKAGKPVPAGTHFVLADYRDGKIYRYFVMEKGEGWGTDYDVRRRTADWQFQWFWPDRSVNMQENTARCQSCHSSRTDSEYLYTFGPLRAFDGKVID